MLHLDVIRITVSPDRDWYRIIRVFAVKSCSQFVALLLLLGVLASPAVAMSDCWSNGLHSSDQPCVPHCANMAAMMEKMAEAAPDSASAGSAMLNCCSVPPSRLEPFSQLTAPYDSSALTVTSVHPFVVPAVQPVAIRTNAGPPPTLCPSQTLLCTFLI